jgi:hypothetical protein
VGFLSLSTLHRNVTGVSPECHRNVTGMSPEFRRDLELEQLNRGDNRNSAFPQIVITFVFIFWGGLGGVLLVLTELPCVVLWRPEALDCRALIPPEALELAYP